MSADQPEDQAFVYEMGRRVRLHRLYRGLTQAVDSYLKQRLQPAAMQLTAAPMASDSLLAVPAPGIGTSLREMT